MVVEYINIFKEGIFLTVSPKRPTNQYGKKEGSDFDQTPGRAE